MKKAFAKVLCLCLCFVMLAGCMVACKKNDGGDTIVIGLSGPLTGGAAVYGLAVKNSAQMAVDEINEAGGLKNGVKFELAAYDDQHDESKVATNYEAMMGKGMHVSLGCVTSNPCLEFAALSAEDNVFFLTPSASNDDVVNESNAYQMCFADGNQGAVAAAQVNAMGLDKIGIFYKSDDTYSKGIYEQFIANLDKNIQVKVTTFTTATETSFKPQIEELKDYSFIFMPIYYGPASTFMTQAKGIIADDAVYYGCDGFDGIESAFDDINTIPQEISMLSHFNSKATDGMAAEYIAKYTEKFGTETLNQFGASAYDCVYALAQAMNEIIEAEGDDAITADISASDLCELLKDKFNSADFKFSGATGTNIQWKSSGFVDKAAVMYPIKAAKNA